VCVGLIFFLIHRQVKGSVVVCVGLIFFFLIHRQVKGPVVVCVGLRRGGVDTSSSEHEEGHTALQRAQRTSRKEDFEERAVTSTNFEERAVKPTDFEEEGALQRNVSSLNLTEGLDLWYFM
jgi:hypothetical protein